MMDLSRIFSYELYTKIVFGIGAAKQVAELVKSLGGTRVLIVTDPGVKGAGLLEHVTLPLTGADIPFLTYADVQPDPEISGVDDCVRLAKENGVDLFIGIGGGSAIDTAKGAAAMMTNPGQITDYLGLGKVQHRAAPWIAIPTTAGTGAEITIWSVLSDRKNRLKVSVGSTQIVANIALCDPALTITMPTKITAATGVDALTHALESYVNYATQPISEAMALRAMELIGRSLRIAVARPDNLLARSEMLMGSLMAALAFNPTRLGIAHALAMPLGGKFHVPHGVCNAVVLPAVCEFNLIGNPQKFVNVAQCLDEKIDQSKTVLENAAKAVDAVRKLNQDVGIPKGLGLYGVEEKHLRELAEEAMLSGNIAVNPRRPTLEDIIEITRQSL